MSREIFLENIKSMGIKIYNYLLTKEKINKKVKNCIEIYLKINE